MTLAASRRSYKIRGLLGQPYEVKVRSVLPSGRISATVNGLGTPLAPEETLPGEPPAEEPPAAEPPGGEPPGGAPPPGEDPAPGPVAGTGPDMDVALDAGGWGPSAFADIAGATRGVRLQSRFATDAEVGGAASAGVTVASWLMGTGGSIKAIEPAAYAAQVVSLFKRYGKGGTFWAGRQDLGGQAVEVLNEPNNYLFWSDPTDYAAYVQLLKAVHHALAANFPAAIRPRVLASWDGGEGPTSPWGPGWAALGGLAYCDGVTVHPYGGSHGQAGGALGGHIDVEQARRLSGKPVYVTEVGWPTAVDQPSTGDSEQWTEEQQAANVASFIAWARQTEYVALVTIFNYVDYGTNNWYGIERRDRTHKPAYTALAEASG